MATTKSGHCKHLDVGCNQGLTWCLDPLIPPPYKQIPEILLDNQWAICVIISLLIYITLDPISAETQKTTMFPFIQTEQ